MGGIHMSPHRSHMWFVEYNEGLSIGNDNPVYDMAVLF